MNLVAYCRVSEKGQVNGLELQKEFFQKFADKIGCNLVKVYADKPITGTRMEQREALLELLEDSKGDSFSMIAVNDVPRLARDTVEFSSIIRQLKENNKQVLFVSYNVDTVNSLC